MSGFLQVSIGRGEGTVSVERVAGTDSEGRVRFLWTVKDAGGLELGSGSDLHSGASGMGAEPERMLGACLSFLEAAADAYGDSMRTGRALAETECGDLFTLEVTEWAYGVADELGLARLELEGEES